MKEEAAAQGFRSADKEAAGFSDADVSRISREQAAIGNDSIWTKEELLADVDRYVAQLYEGVADEEGN